MKKTAQLLRDYPQLAAVLVTFLVLIPASLAGVNVQWPASIIALIIAGILFVGMVKDLLGGAVGIDLLAIVAICATVAVSQYWAALVVCLMLSGGKH